MRESCDKRVALRYTDTQHPPDKHFWHGIVPCTLNSQLIDSPHIDQYQNLS